MVIMEIVMSICQLSVIGTRFIILTVFHYLQKVICVRNIRTYIEITLFSTILLRGKYTHGQTFGLDKSKCTRTGTRLW